ncbi:unnamed protein product [Paramecium sonneborni]|uniref:Uncharacterized protein n=1 Tax=Paramecium sonneborni TaxID=65129 RepID=A0A8S1R4T3_9CILI|nr:unnamed protein product [Paramecium sonneborni]
MNSASNNQLLQKLQNLYSAKQKPSQHSHSPTKTNSSKQINQLLQKSTPLPYLQIKQQDIEQWTDRINTQIDKHKSFSQNDNTINFYLQKPLPSNPLFQQSFITSLIDIQKKLKLLKYAKENDQNTFVSIITKIKLFCLDNSAICFDFYRCNDLILLKYMIYLLIFQFNQDIQKNQKESNSEQTLQLQNMVKDIITIIYEIIEEIKSKQHNISHIDTLNHQLTQIQNKFKPANACSLKTINKSSHQRYNSFNLEKNKSAVYQSKYAADINLSTNQLNSNPQFNNGQQKIIQNQNDELEQNSKLIISLNNQIQKLQKNYKKQIFSISELNDLNQSLKQQLQSKIEELEHLKNSFELLKSNNKLYLEQKEQYFNLYHDLELENRKLKQNLQKYQVDYDQIKTEFEKYQTETYFNYQKQLNQIQQTKDNEIKSIKVELNEKCSIITQLLGDVLFFGKQYKNIVDKIINIQKKDLEWKILELQKELFVSENTLNAKLNAISSYSNNIIYNQGQEYLKQNQLSNLLGNQTISYQSDHQKNTKQSRVLDLLSDSKNSFELMHMLLIQSQVLEEFLS